MRGVQGLLPKDSKTGKPALAKGWRASRSTSIALGDPDCSASPGKTLGPKSNTFHPIPAIPHGNGYWPRRRVDSLTTSSIGGASSVTGLPPIKSSTAFTRMPPNSNIGWRMVVRGGVV